jgi:hypothetical protein
MRCRTTGVEGGRNHVVDVEKKVGGVKAVVEDEQRRVHLGLNEAERHDVLGEMLEPHTWCLAKSVERPREQTQRPAARGRRNQWVADSRLAHGDCHEETHWRHRAGEQAIRAWRRE